MTRAYRAAATLGALGPMLGAGVLLAPAPAAAVTGRWLPVAVLLAAFVASLGSASPARTRAREVLPIGVPARVFAAGAVARCAGEYVLPARPWTTALAVLAFTGALATLASRGALRTSRRFVVAIVLCVLAITVLACFAIGGPGNAAVPRGVAGSDDAAAIPAAAALLVFAFGGGPRATRTRLRAHLAVGIACLLVVFALLRQLGPGRLAVSPVPLADALAAADAAALVPLLLAAVVLAALGVAYGAVTDVSRTLAGRGRHTAPYVLACSAAAFAVAVVLPTRTSIAIASGCLLLGWLASHLRVLAEAAGTRGRVPAFRQLGAAVGAVLSILLFVVLPFAALAIAFGASVLAVSLAAWSRSSLGGHAGNLGARE